MISLYWEPQNTCMFKKVLLILGLVLIGFGLYNAFVPKEVLDIGPLEVSAKEGLSSESLILIALGVVSVIAGIFLGRK